MWKKLETVDKNCFWESGAKFEPVATFEYNNDSIYSEKTSKAHIQLIAYADSFLMAYSGVLVGEPTNNYYRQLFIPQEVVFEMYRLIPKTSPVKDSKDEKINNLEEEVARLKQRCNDWKEDYTRDASGDVIKTRIENNQLREENEQLRKKLLHAEDEGRWQAMQHIIRVCQNIMQSLDVFSEYKEKSKNDSLPEHLRPVNLKDAPEGYMICKHCNGNKYVGRDGEACLCTKYGTYPGFMRKPDFNDSSRDTFD